MEEINFRPYQLLDEEFDSNLNQDEIFELFKEAYDTRYGSIEQDGNLIEIHTGGWSENEYLISDLSKTWWWNKYYVAEFTGGHYYFDKARYRGLPTWKITKVPESIDVFNKS